MGLPELRTPRCVLTVLRPEHADLWLTYRVANAAHLSGWEPARDPADGPLEQVIARQAEKSLQAFEDGTAVQLVALDAGSGGMVAACNFTQIVRGPLQACYLGYSVDKDLQGQGGVDPFPRTV